MTEDQHIGRQAGDEIEVTEEMRDAGARVIGNYFDQVEDAYTKDAAEAAFRRMYTCLQKQKRRPSEGQKSP